MVTPPSVDATASTDPGSSEPTTTLPSATDNGPPPGGPATASAEGWTLVIGAPVAGSKIGPTTTVCYQITGEIREADVALDVTVTSPGSPDPVTSIRPKVAVGRGEVELDLTGVALGTYDLSIGLVVGGELPPDRVVRITDVARVKRAAARGCGLD